MFQQKLIHLLNGPNRNMVGYEFNYYLVMKKSFIILKAEKI
jgi:hypothetical protein